MNVSCFSQFIWNKLKVTFHSTDCPRERLQDPSSRLLPGTSHLLTFHHLRPERGSARRTPTTHLAPYPKQSARLEPASDRPPCAVKVKVSFKMTFVCRYTQLRRSVILTTSFRFYEPSSLPLRHSAVLLCLGFKCTLPVASVSILKRKTVSHQLASFWLLHSVRTHL